MHPSHSCADGVRRTARPSSAETGIDAGPPRAVTSGDGAAGGESVGLVASLVR